MVVRCITWKETLKCLLGRRHYFRVFGSNNQCRKMWLKHSRCMQHLSSLHLCCSLFLSEIHQVFMMKTASGWSRSTDCRSSSTVWSKRWLPFFQPFLNSPLLPASFFFSSASVIFIFACLSSHHPGHLVFTSLSQINHILWHVDSKQYQQINSTQQHPPTYKHIHICISVCSMKSVVNWHIIRCFRDPNSVYGLEYEPRNALTLYCIDLFLFNPLYYVIS